MPVKKDITYTSLDGAPVTVEYWFSLGKTDAIEMDIAHQENAGEYLQSLIDNNDSRKMLELWKELLFRSVALREGEMLVKGDAVIKQFVGTGAYEQFFSDLIEMPDAGASFFLSIMPADIQEKAAQGDLPDRVYTDEEKLNMTDEEFMRVVGKDENMSKHDLLIAFRRKTLGSKAA